jgi:hypothetical protein
MNRVLATCSQKIQIKEENSAGIHETPTDEKKLQLHLQEVLNLQQGLGL